jgi:hypothetical protein
MGPPTLYITPRLSYVWVSTASRSFECSINIVVVTFEYISRFSDFRIKRLIEYYLLIELELYSMAS